MLLLYLSVFTLVGLVVTFGIKALGQNQTAKQHWNDVLTRQTVIVGIDPGEQPYSFYSESGWDGLDADICREAASRLNLKIQAIPVGYDSLYDSLRLAQVDMVMSAISADPTRMTDYTYSESYYDAGLRAVSVIKQDVKSIDDLAGKRVLVVLGSDTDRSMRYWQRRLTDVTIIEVNDVGKA
ncbi:MAG TPA: transporter substrate-binding domain-containing protein, partial [Anaerolineae bacterium]